MGRRYDGKYPCNVMAWISDETMDIVERFCKVFGLKYSEFGREAILAFIEQPEFMEELEKAEKEIKIEAMRNTYNQLKDKDKAVEL